MKSYKVIFSPSFIKMFEDELNNYISYSSAYTRKIEKKVYEAINLLKIFPYATPTIKFRGDPQVYRKFIVKKKFLIVFKVLDDTIHLDYFIDGRQAPKNYLKIYKK
ncbi:MAG: hypothetical protein IKV94_03955 [Clostridia bacterium]|nr:hypothetical protein [Clostridia bacterium]